MKTKFQKTIEYLQELKYQIENQTEELTIEQKLIQTIKNAILTSEHRHGSIMFTETENGYYVSHIQRHQYGFSFTNQVVDITSLIENCQLEGISCQLEPDAVGPNQYKLSFDLIPLKKKTKKNI